MIDIDAVRAQFPALHQDVYGKPLVYLDSGATSQKPEAVIAAMAHYYQRDNANVHRGVHALSARATAAFEDARAFARNRSAYDRGETREFGLSRVDLEALIPVVEGRTPLKRWAEPREIGGAAVFLAADAGSYVNGHLLAVDGGMISVV